MRQIWVKDNECFIAESFAEYLADCTPEELNHFRAVINGKMSKRKITPEQQEAMQKGRKRKGT